MFERVSTVELGKGFFAGEPPFYLKAAQQAIVLRHEPLSLKDLHGGHLLVVLAGDVCSTTSQ